VLSDGSVKLIGKVSDSEVKRSAIVTAQVYHDSDDPGDHSLNKIIDELVVTGKYVADDPDHHKLRGLP
jgi:hypothetical protein